MLIVVFNLIATLKNCFSTTGIMIKLVYVLYIWHRHLQETILVVSKYPHVKIHLFYFPLPPDITAFFVSYYMICAWQSKFSHPSAGNVLQSMHSQIVTVVPTTTAPQSANQRHKQWHICGWIYKCQIINVESNKHIYRVWWLRLPLWWHLSEKEKHCC